jgi:hypothetical protein
MKTCDGCKHDTEYLETICGECNRFTQDYMMHEDLYEKTPTARKTITLSASFSDNADTSKLIGERFISLTRHINDIIKASELPGIEFVFTSEIEEDE